MVYSNATSGLEPTGKYYVWHSSRRSARKGSAGGNRKDSPDSNPKRYQKLFGIIKTFKPGETNEAPNNEHYEHVKDLKSLYATAFNIKNAWLAPNPRNNIEALGMIKVLKGMANLDAKNRQILNKLQILFQNAESKNCNLIRKLVTQNRRIGPKPTTQNARSPDTLSLPQETNPER